MDRNRRVTLAVHGPHPPCPRMVYRYVFLTSLVQGDMLTCTVCYSLGIYLLNLFLAFLTPKFDPSLEQELADQDSEEGTSGGLPTKQDDEFRPFIRRSNNLICIADISDYPNSSSGIQPHEPVPLHSYVHGSPSSMSRTTPRYKSR